MHSKILQNNTAIKKDQALFAAELNKYQQEIERLQKKRQATPEEARQIRNYLETVVQAIDEKPFSFHAINKDPEEYLCKVFKCTKESYVAFVQANSEKITSAMFFLALEEKLRRLQTRRMDLDQDIKTVLKMIHINAIIQQKETAYILPQGIYWEDISYFLEKLNVQRSNVHEDVQYCFCEYVSSERYGLIDINAGTTEDLLIASAHKSYFAFMQPKTGILLEKMITESINRKTAVNIFCKARAYLEQGQEEKAKKYLSILTNQALAAPQAAPEKAFALIDIDAAAYDGQVLLGFIQKNDLPGFVQQLTPLYDNLFLQEIKDPGTVIHQEHNETGGAFHVRGNPFIRLQSVPLANILFELKEAEQEELIALRLSGLEIKEQASATKNERKIFGLPIKDIVKHKDIYELAQEIKKEINNPESPFYPDEKRRDNKTKARKLESLCYKIGLTGIGLLIVSAIFTLLPLFILSGVVFFIAATLEHRSVVLSKAAN